MEVDGRGVKSRVTKESGEFNHVGFTNDSLFEVMEEYVEFQSKEVAML